MKICGTKNNMPFSWFIRKALNEGSSHIIFIGSNGIAVHSNPAGVHLDWDKTFRKHNQVNWELDVQVNSDQEMEIIKHVMDHHDEECYDWMAIIYFAWCLLLKWVLDRPIPKRNLWQSKNSLLCVALPSKTPRWFLGDLDEAEIEMSSPDQIVEIIKLKLFEKNIGFTFEKRG